MVILKLTITAYNLKCTIIKAISEGSSKTTLPPRVPGNNPVKTHLLHATNPATTPDMNRNQTADTTLVTKSKMKADTMPSTKKANFLTAPPSPKAQEYTMTTNTKNDPPPSPSLPSSMRNTSTTAYCQC